MTEEAHRLVSEVVRRGDRAVDATAGNGHDSIFLAKLVGPDGQVFAFDIQEEACRETERRLREEGGSGEVICCGHEQMAERVSGPVRAVMFNLGYLPGGDKSVTTLPGSTVEALGAALGLLDAGGIVTVLCYTGHAGGGEEAAAVLDFCEGLGEEDFAAVRYEASSAGESAPILVAVSKRIDREGPEGQSVAS